MMNIPHASKAIQWRRGRKVIHPIYHSWLVCVVVAESYEDLHPLLWGIQPFSLRDISITPIDMHDACVLITKDNKEGSQRNEGPSVHVEDVPNEERPPTD